MPKRHGLFRHYPPGLPSGTPLTAEHLPSFRCGIRSVLRALQTVKFLSDAERRKAVILEYHFREVCQRFVYGLQHLNGLMQRMAAGHERTPAFESDQILEIFESLQLQFEAGYQADHVLTDLSTIVDDIAHVILLVTGAPSPDPKRPIDSLGKLKTALTDKKLPLPATVSALLTELETSGTWWELAFATHVGGRQLLIHNPTESFFTLLRRIFASLCDWLDRLEKALADHITSRDSSVTPKSECPQISLPVGYPAVGVEYVAAYFPLPLCDGADPLPWKIG